MIIEVDVSNKIAQLRNRTIVGVCGNSDYVVHFNFDTEWDAYETKTARFKWGGTFTDVVFTGNECPMPIIYNTNTLEIGVYAGELHTTTAAVLYMKKSVLCGNASESKESQELKDNMNKILAEKVDVPQTASVGDVLTVEEVDDNGKPTKWKAATKKQANWEQNDSTAEDYVQGRTHYRYITDGTAVTDLMSGNALRSYTTELVGFEEGANYTFKVNDAEYTSVVQRVAESETYSYLKATSSDGKYAIQKDDDGSILFRGEDGQREKNDKFEFKKYAYKKIPTKYSPLRISSYWYLYDDENEIDDYNYAVNNLYISSNLLEADSGQLVETKWVTPTSAADSPFGTDEQYLELSAVDNRAVSQYFYYMGGIAFIYAINNPSSNYSVKFSYTPDNYDDEFGIAEREELYSFLSEYNAFSAHLMRCPLALRVNGVDYKSYISTVSVYSMHSIVSTKEGYVFNISILFNNTGADDLCAQDWTINIKRII